MAYRDPQTGRFVSGNPGGPGRPVKSSRPSEANYLQAMHNVVSLADFEKLTLKMVEQILKEGDVAAYKVLASYLAGLPVQRLQLSSADADKLAAVLIALHNRGLSAGLVFDRMLAEFALQAQENEADDG